MDDQEEKKLLLALSNLDTYHKLSKPFRLGVLKGNQYHFDYR